MHYDFAPVRAHARRYAGLSGPAEDAVALVLGPYKDKANALEAYKQFVFGTTNIDKKKRHDRARANEVTAEYKRVANSAKFWVIGPFAPDVKDMKADERERLYSWIWKAWEDAWKKAGLPNKQAPSREDLIEQAKVRAKGEAEARALALRQRGAADAAAGTYKPPAPPASGPDFDLRMYQSGWTSTGKPLPAGVVDAVAASAPPAGTEPGKETAPPSSFPIVPVLAVVGVLGAAFFFLRKKG